MALELLASTSLSQLNELDKQFVCTLDNCNREFNSKRNLVDHIRGHHQGTKPHMCEYPGCGKSFLRPAHLQIHMRIHTGEKPFACPFDGCGKRWNQKSALKQHLRSHTGEKPFVCSVEGCTKSFSTSSSCKRHVLTHTKEGGSSPSSPISQSPPSSPISSPKRKYIGFSDSSSDEEYERYVPTKRANIAAPPTCAMTHMPPEKDYFKMTLNFILN